MQRTRTFRALLVGLCASIVLAATPSRGELSAAEVQGASALIEALGDQAIGLLRDGSVTLEQREEHFRALLRKGFDMPLIARFVLGRYWQRADEEEQAEYLELFSEYILKTYARRMGGYSGEEFEVLGARAAGEQDVLVRTRITRKAAPPIVADWRVRLRDGEYRIVDLVVEGVSMAVTQRAEFAAVIQRRGMSGLLQALRARTQSFPATAS